MNTFSISVDHTNHDVVLHLHGYLDAHTANDFERELRSIIEQGALRIIVDFANLDYISSAGLGVFMVFIEDLRRKHGDILLAAMRPNVYSVFDLLGFHVLFKIFDSVEAAQASGTNAS